MIYEFNRPEEINLKPFKVIFNKITLSENRNHLKIKLSYWDNCQRLREINKRKKETDLYIKIPKKLTDDIKVNINKTINLNLELELIHTVIKNIKYLILHKNRNYSKYHYTKIQKIIRFLEDIENKISRRIDVKPLNDLFGGE